VLRLRTGSLRAITREGHPAALPPPGHAQPFSLSSAHTELGHDPASGEWPRWIETAVRTELRAVAADIRHASLFLASVVRERDTASLDSEDERLTYAVELYVQDLERIANGIETFLGPIWVNHRLLPLTGIR
jgi:hypothetical protein